MGREDLYIIPTINRVSPTMNDTCSDETCTIDHAPADDIDGERTFEPGPGKNILIFADPMCSWCWGFAPEAERIRTAIKGRAQLHIVMGGLRPGTTETWDQEMRDYIRHHWEDVEAKTGQPFDYARLDNKDFVYDTEPGCRALVSARLIDPESAPAMLDALHRSFYAEGRDINDANVLADIAATCGIERERFKSVFASPEARAEVTFDFNRTRAFGVTGFPTVLCADDGQYAFLTLGYRPFSAMGPLLEEWLNA